MGTNIEWCKETWNPVTGCTPISPGCANCYAARMAKRLAGRFGYPADDPFRPATVHNTKPPTSRKPMMVFVCSMGDLFHDAVDFESVELVLDDISKADPDLKHKWLFFTKRPDRMLKFTQWMAGADHISTAEWPRNCWIGVTAENQEQADRRIPILLQIPAAVRFVSVEPMLGPVEIKNMQGAFWIYDDEYGTGGRCKAISGIKWVICGGESGPGARPMHPDWARDLRYQCVAAGVPFFFKQWGEHIASCNHGEWEFYRVGKKKAGRMLDGQTWDEYPEVA